MFLYGKVVKELIYMVHHLKKLGTLNGILKRDGLTEKMVEELQLTLTWTIGLSLRKPLR